MKHGLRSEIKAALAAMPTQQRRDASHAAARALLAQPEFDQAMTIMAFLSTADEMDTTPLVLGAWQKGKTVVVPKVDRASRHMLPMRIESLQDGLSAGAYGIREPGDGEPWPLEQIDLIVVPALAFDRRGHRLGRGGGYYDRFLAQPTLRAIRCGLAYSSQVRDRLPIESHDLPVNMLVTDTEVLRFALDDIADITGEGARR